MQPVFYSVYSGHVGVKTLDMANIVHHEAYNDVLDSIQGDWLQGYADGIPKERASDAANSGTTSPLLSQEDATDSDGDSGTRHVTRLSLSSVQESAQSSCLEMDSQDCFEPDMQPTPSLSCPTPGPKLNASESASGSPFIRAIGKSKRRRGSMGAPRRPNPMSVLVQPRQTKSSIQMLGKRPFQPMPEKSIVHWDPHIDSFELLRAKITGITRTMQEFHVQQLFQDELSQRDNKWERRRTASDVLSEWHTDKAWPSSGHRRNRSHSSLHYNSMPLQPPTPTPEPNSHRYTNEEADDLDSVDKPTSPNLTALFWTTNSLIHSRLDELSETASIASSCDLSPSAAEWRTQFLNLVSSCITQSEELESLSTELLGTELKVRELSVLNDSVNEQFTEREKAYEERLRECQCAEKQQLLMIDTLNELLADLDMKLEQLARRQDAAQQEAAHETEQPDTGSTSSQGRWDFAQRIADILNLETKDDLIHKMRWEVGMFVGGGVGTGHVIHTFEGRLKGIEMMIAGSGTTVVDHTLRSITITIYCICARKNVAPDSNFFHGCTGSLTISLTNASLKVGSDVLPAFRYSSGNIIAGGAAKWCANVIVGIDYRSLESRRPRQSGVVCVTNVFVT